MHFNNINRKNFIELYLDAGGKWARLIEKGRFHFVEMIDWEEHGVDWKEPGHGNRYIGELSEVDVLAASDKLKESAMQCCGDQEWYDEITENMTDAEKGMVMAEMLFDYGAKAPLDEVSLGSWHRVVAAMKKRSYELTGNPEELEQLMERSVNQIGSTAREFMHGDIMAGITRGVQDGKQNAKIMAKMYGNSEESIATVAAAGPQPSGAVHASIRMGSIPSDDPIAYSMGFMQAMSGQGLDQHGTERDELAEAYIEGHKLGWSVRAGDVPKPDWVR